ncbi:hypothetical protein [Nevskia soli]|uniref:hypothetical protein n=1 Tax=Nevskia soli TaxID=418856 RepID=UPI0004A72EED|nr:hypothetical protein [Nevskia soli]
MSGFPVRALVHAALAAVAVQPIVFCIWPLLPVVLSGTEVSWQEVLALLACVLVVASVFVILLGVPSFLLLLRLGQPTFLAAGLTGFFVAAMPLAILSWPSQQGMTSSGGNWFGRQVEFYVSGVPTLYEWLSFADGLLRLGFYGLISALVFFAVWRKRLYGRAFCCASQSSHSRPSR